MNNDKNSGAKNMDEKDQKNSSSSPNWGMDQNKQDKNRQGGSDGENKGGATNTPGNDPKTSGGNDQKR